MDEWSILQPLEAILVNYFRGMEHNKSRFKVTPLWILHQTTSQSTITHLKDEIDVCRRAPPTYICFSSSSNRQDFVGVDLQSQESVIHRDSLWFSSAYRPIYVCIVNEGEKICKAHPSFIPIAIIYRYTESYRLRTSKRQRSLMKSLFLWSQTFW